MKLNINIKRFSEGFEGLFISPVAISKYALNKVLFNVDPSVYPKVTEVTYCVSILRSFNQMSVILPSSITSFSDVGDGDCKKPFDEDSFITRNVNTTDLRFNEDYPTLTDLSVKFFQVSYDNTLRVIDFLIDLVQSRYGFINQGIIDGITHAVTALSNNESLLNSVLNSDVTTGVKCGFFASVMSEVFRNSFVLFLKELDNETASSDTQQLAQAKLYRKDILKVLGRENGNKPICEKLYFSEELITMYIEFLIGNDYTHEQANALYMCALCCVNTSVYTKLPKSI